MGPILISPAEQSPGLQGLPVVFQPPAGLGVRSLNDHLLSPLPYIYKHDSALWGLRHIHFSS